MIIIGHELVPYEPFYRVNSVSQIKKTPSNSNILTSFDKEIILFCQKNCLVFGVEVHSAKEALIANGAKASFLIVNNTDLAKKIQNMAENYLFDAKVLVYIKHEEEIENIANQEIDGVLFLNDKVIKNGKI